jgi:hypothetical protein
VFWDFTGAVRILGHDEPDDFDGWTDHCFITHLTTPLVSTICLSCFVCAYCLRTEENAWAAKLSVCIVTLSAANKGLWHLHIMNTARLCTATSSFVFLWGISVVAHTFCGFGASLQAVLLLLIIQVLLGGLLFVRILSMATAGKMSKATKKTKNHHTSSSNDSLECDASNTDLANNPQMETKRRQDVAPHLPRHTFCLPLLVLVSVPVTSAQDCSCYGDSWVRACPSESRRCAFTVC